MIGQYNLQAAAIKALNLTPERSTPGVLSMMLGILCRPTPNQCARREIVIGSVSSPRRRSDSARSSDVVSRSSGASGMASSSMTAMKRECRRGRQGGMQLFSALSSKKPQFHHCVPSNRPGRTPAFHWALAGSSRRPKRAAVGVDLGSIWGSARPNRSPQPSPTVLH